MSSVEKIETSSVKREFKVKLEEGYRYKNVCLLQNLKVKKHKSFKLVTMLINGVVITPTEVTKTDYIFDMAQVRKANREIVFPEDQNEQNRIRLENMFVYNGLKAISFYPNPTNEVLQNSIFTMELEIMFKVQSTKPPKHLEIEEVVYTSQAQADKAQT